jgi:predicted alpha/beta hydrolase family esterase
VTHLALVVPGSGYGPAGPALLLPRLAAEQVGADVRDVAYPDWRPGLDDERAQAFTALVAADIRAAVEEVRPQRLTLLAKSLGCEVVARMDPAAVAAAPEVAVLWCTPVFARPAVRDGAIAKGWRSLVVIGDADRWYDPAALEAVVRATRAETLVLEGADHSLERAGDVLGTVEGFRRLAAATLAFLG